MMRDYDEKKDSDMEKYNNDISTHRQMPRSEQKIVDGNWVRQCIDLFLLANITLSISNSHKDTTSCKSISYLYLCSLILQAVASATYRMNDIVRSMLYWFDLAIILLYAASIVILFVLNSNISHLYLCSLLLQAYIFPITPSSPMGETVDEWAATDDENGNKKYRNLWDQELKVCEMQSEGRFMKISPVYILVWLINMILNFCFICTYEQVEQQVHCMEH